MKTEGSPRSTHLRLVGEEESGSVSLNCGAKSLPSIISPSISRDHQLSESLNYLDSEIQTLEFRFYEVCSTLNIAIARLVELGLIGSRINITEEEE